MPSMRSIGLTDSRMMASSLSMSFMPHGRQPRVGAQQVLRLVHQPRALGIDLEPDARRQRPDLLGIGVRLGFGAHRRAAIGRRRLLGAGGDREPHRVALGLLLGHDQLDALAPLRHLGLAGGEDLLLRRHRERPRLVGRRLRLGLRPRLLGDGDRPLLLGQLDRLAALDLELLDVALLGDALLLDRPFRGDAAPARSTGAT